MNTQHLEYIITIFEEKTLLKASEKLFVSPSALSQFVGKLEAELNTKLFSRTKDGWTPTVAGSIYIEMARNILDLQRRTYNEISMVADSFTSTITVGTSPGGMASMLATIFPAFNTRFPNIKINLLEARISDILRLVEEGKVNLAFISAGNIDAFSSPHVCAELISTEDLLLAVPMSHPPVTATPASGDQAYPTISLTQFRSTDFMLMSPGTTLRQAEDELFAIAGFQPSVIFEASSIQTVYTFAKTGYAATILPALYVHPSAEIRYYKIDSHPRWNRFVTYSTKQPLSAPEKHLLSLAKSYYWDR